MSCLMVVDLENIKKLLKYLERIDIFHIFAAENNRASEYRVGLQFRREGFRGPVLLLYLGYCLIYYAPNIHSR